MTKGLNRSLRRSPKIRSPIQKLHLHVVAKVISVVGATGNGFGGLLLQNFPEGNILILGAVADNLQFTAGANTIATFTGTFGVGTTLVNAATIATTQQNIVGVTATAAATGSVSPLTRGVTAPVAGPLIVDNTDSQLGIFLNMTIDDASISGTTPVTVTGEIYISYVVLGDD